MTAFVVEFKVTFERRKYKPRNLWYFVTKIVLTYCEKNCSSDLEKLFKLDAEGRELAKCHNNFGNKIPLQRRS